MSAFESIGRFTGRLHPDVDSPDFRRWLTRLPDVPGYTLVTEGRDCVYQVEAPTAAGRLSLAVKAFGAEPIWKNRVDRVNGSRAQRAYDHACWLRERGVSTPAPAAFLERWEGGRLREHLLITRFVTGGMTFRDALLYHYHEDPLCRHLMNLLQVVADTVSSMHRAGFEHRDLGNQNLLVKRNDQGDWEQGWVVDLHRGRCHEEGMSPELRGRDCARISLPSDLRRVFLQMLDAPEVLPEEFLQAERLQRRRVACWTRTRPLRHPFTRRDTSPTYPPEQDIWIWDDRSMQAIPALGGKDKRRHYRRADALSMAGAVLRHALPVRRAYHDLLENAWSEPVSMRDRIGLGINPDPDRFDRELRWLNALGTLPVMVRLYHHEPATRRRFAIEAVRRLQAEGHRVTIAFVQDRKAVLQPRKWAGFVESAAGALSGFVEGAEVGHAINRVKWGVWTLPEYRRLMEPFQNWGDRFPQIPLMGPAGIDFEYPRVLPLLDRLPAGTGWSALSHHLYVDRRGAPENEQSGFDTVKKLALARAIARVHPRCADRLVVSEVNWPLLGTGVWSPVGSPYQSPGPRHGDPSVDEDTYAAYMVRYLLLALCSGLADRVYWWNLAAHGFGLIDDQASGGWRPRPAYHALKHLLTETRDATYVGRSGEGGDHVLRFERPQGLLCASWHSDGTALPLFD